MDETLSEDQRQPSAADTTQLASFEHLAESHLEPSYRLAHAILGDIHEAQDAVHDAFVTAWRKWQSLRDPARFTPWFQRILINTCRNRLKRASRMRTSLLSDAPPEAVPDRTGLIHDRDLLDRAFEDLRPDDRIVLILRYYRDMKVEDIAAVLEVRSGTVMSRLHRAQGRLRAALEPDDGQEVRR